MKYKRYCSKCDSEIIYNSSSTRNRAKRKNSLCKSCGNSNYDIWLEKYGKTIAEEKLKKANEKRSKTCIESNRFNIHNPMYVTDIAKKSGTSKKGKKGGFFGKMHSIETKQKMRLSAIKRIENTVGQVIPNYNPKSISILKQKANELGITDLQHAENGGEFYIKDLGYWVDGYSKEKNIVIEYYEPFHDRHVKRDTQRKNEIIKLLNCDFIEIK